MTTFMGVLHTLLIDPSTLAFIDIFGIIVSIIVSMIPYMLRQKQGLVAHMVLHPKFRSGSNEWKITWKMWNCGSKTVAKSDYLQPIEFVFGSHASVTKVTIKKTVPPVRRHPHSPPAWSGNSAELAPIALDRGHSITLEFLVKNVDFAHTDVILLFGRHKHINVNKERIERAGRFFVIECILVAAWILTLFMRRWFSVLPSVYYVSAVSVVLALLIALLGMRIVSYFVPALLVHIK